MRLVSQSTEPRNEFHEPGDLTFLGSASYFAVMNGLILAGAIFMIGGLVPELIVGRFREFFDLTFPKRNDPSPGGEWIKLFLFRIQLMVATPVFVAGLLWWYLPSLLFGGLGMLLLAAAYVMLRQPEYVPKKKTSRFNFTSDEYVKKPQQPDARTERRRHTKRAVSRVVATTGAALILVNVVLEVVG